MNTKIIVTIAVATVLLLTACNSKHNETEDHNHESTAIEHEAPHANEIHFSAQQAEAADLQVEKIKAGDFRNVIKASGEIEIPAGQEQTIAATANGIVSFVKTPFVEGVAVQTGEALVVISAKNLPEGDLAYKTKIAYEVTEKEFRRAESLVKDNIISAKEYEQARLNYENARTAYEAHAANMTANGVTSTSKMDGFVKTILVKQGEYVSVGQSIAVVAQNKRLQLRAEVSEKYYGNLSNIIGANFRTSYDNVLYRLEDLNGKLLSYGKSAGDNSFYIPITFEFDNVGNIVPGSFVDIYLLSQVKSGVISVPISALTEEQGIYFVYTKIPDEEAYLKQEVIVGQSNGERIEILKGLSEGELVVIKGVYQVKLAASSSVIPEGHSHNH